MTPDRVVTLRADGLLLAVDVTRVQEVLEDGVLTPVPLADPALSGLLNLRGQVVEVIDVRRRLGRTPAAPGDAGTVYVTTVGTGAVGLRVDEVGEVVDVGEPVVEVPETVAAAIRAVAVGVVRVTDGLAVLLDVDRVVGAVPAGGGR